MFTIPQGSIVPKEEGVVRVIGTDPSTTNMGVTVIDINVMKREKFKLRYVNTIFGEKVLHSIPVQFNDLADTGVLARSYGLSRAFRELIELYEPDTGICEDNFLGISAGTFKQLIQAVSLYREAANGPKMPIHFSYVLPNLAKAIVGANFKGTKKEDVIEGIQKYDWLDSGEWDLSKLDEHSADSVAITLYRCEQIAMHFGVFKDDTAK